MAVVVAVVLVVVVLMTAVVVAVVETDRGLPEQTTKQIILT